MSLIDVHATVKMDGILAAFERLRRLDLLATFKRIRPPARWDQRDHDNNRVAPDGPWRGLAASTLERRKRKRGRDKSGRRRSWPTKLLGRLPVAVESKVSRQSLIVRSRVRPAGFGLIHQAGGVAGRGARIPRRQYLWISPWLLGQAKKEFQAALRAAWDRRWRF